MKETHRSSESSVLDDRELVKLISDGVEAERALAELGENGAAVTSMASGGVEADTATGEAVDAERSALKKRRDAGQRAAAALFLRCQLAIEAFARSRGLRSELAPGNLRRDLPSVEELVNEVYVRVFWSRRVGTWRGEGSFRGWLRTVLKNLLVDMIRERSREVPLDDDTRTASSWGERAGTAEKLDDGAMLGEVEAGAAEEHGIREDEPDAPGGGTLAAGVSAPASSQPDPSEAEPARRIASLKSIIDAMPDDRRLVYRLSYALELTGADLAHLARKSGRDESSVRQEVDRLYEWFRERSDARLARMARGYLKCESELRSVHASLRARQGRVPRTHEQEQEMAPLICRSRELQDKLGELAARLKKIRVPSKHVAKIMGTTANNVDQHLRRARQDVDRATGNMKGDIT